MGLVRSTNVSKFGCTFGTDYGTDTYVCVHGRTWEYQADLNFGTIDRIRILIAVHTQHACSEDSAY